MCVCLDGDDCARLCERTRVFPPRFVWRLAPPTANAGAATAERRRGYHTARIAPPLDFTIPPRARRISPQSHTLLPLL